MQRVSSMHICHINPLLSLPNSSNFAQSIWVGYFCEPSDDYAGFLDASDSFAAHHLVIALISLHFAIVFWFYGVFWFLGVLWFLIIFWILGVFICLFADLIAESIVYFANTAAARHIILAVAEGGTCRLGWRR